MRSRFTPTSILAYTLLGVGVMLALKSAPRLLEVSFWSMGSLVILGVMALLILHRRSPLESNSVAPVKGAFGKLVLLQSFFIIMSLFWFVFLERQVNLSPQLAGAAPHSFFIALQEHPLLLGCLPWALYSVLGVGLAYTSFTLGRKPFFSRILVWDTQPNKVRFFLHEFMMGANYIVLVLPMVLLTVFLMVFLCETVGALLGWHSLFSTPGRTLLISALVVMLLQKPIKKLVEHVKGKTLSIGGFLVTHIISFSVFFLLIQFAIEFFYSEEMILLENQIPMMVSDSVLKEHQVGLLILGWWAVWVPWMASWIARLSLKGSLIGSFIRAMILPSIVFGLQLDWTWIEKALESNAIRVVVFGVGLFWLWRSWSSAYQLVDVYRGAMPSTPCLSHYSVKKWLWLVSNWVISYGFGYLLMGWKITEFITTLGLLIMLASSLLFVLGLLASIRFSSVSKRENLLFSK